MQWADVFVLPSDKAATIATTVGLVLSIVAYRWFFSREVVKVGEWE